MPVAIVWLERVVCGGDMSISAQATSGRGNVVRLLSHCSSTFTGSELC